LNNILKIGPIINSIEVQKYKVDAVIEKTI